MNRIGRKQVKSVQKEDSRNYLLMPEADTYALGIHALRKACQKENNFVHPQLTLSKSHKSYRPLTFRENLEARVNDYESGSKKGLFEEDLGSCTGIAYEAGTTNFKVIPLCQELILLPKNFQTGCISGTYDSLNGTPPIDYDSLDGIELSVFMIGDGSNWEDLPEHPFWRAAAEEDSYLLRSYTKIISRDKRKDEADWTIDFEAYSEHAHSYWGPNFEKHRWEWQTKYEVKKDELNALTLGDLGYFQSRAFISPLTSRSHFIKVAGY